MFNGRSIKLVKGVGDPETGGCWMSALGAFAGVERWHDYHPCFVDHVINEVCIVINDLLPTDESRGIHIGPRLLDPWGTVDPEAEESRLMYLIDRAIRYFTPIELRHAGFGAAADKLESCPEVTKGTIHAMRHMMPRTHMSLNMSLNTATYASAALNAAAEAEKYAVNDATYATGKRSCAATCAIDAVVCAAEAAAQTAYTAGYRKAIKEGRMAFAAAREAFVVTHMFPILDKLIAMGKHAPAGSCANPERFAKSCQMA